jgi:hypothetical protein
MNFCNFIQQRLRADDFQIPPHRQALFVIGHFKRNRQTENKSEKYENKILHLDNHSPFCKGV